ncbi:MAG: hypothetical protein CML29_14705 [Rhizobiales bacterium]|nr:hypothetical protein [Hyphomicrobiales bacterium]
MAVVFLVAELLLYLLFFQALGRRFLKPDGTTPPGVTLTDLFKGAFERCVIAYGLVLGYPHILTLFGAMKLGTRLKSSSETREFNNYYLIGNLASVCAAMAYSRHLAPDSAFVAWLVGLLG